MMKPSRRRLLVPCALLPLLLTACSPFDILNLLSNSGRYRAAQDISYGPHPRQAMDVYRPMAENSKACRIVFVYGGSWREGSRKAYGFVGAALARRGYTVYIPDYRLYPEVTYPAFVEDLARALAHPMLSEAAPAAGPLVLMGHSAGALNAALVSYDPHYLRQAGLPPSLVDAYIGLAGPHDYFLPTDNPRWVAIFGADRERQLSALSVGHVGADDPPALILHGEKDDIVTPRSARSLARRLEEAGVAYRLRLYPGSGHRRIVAALAPPLGFLAPTLDDVDDWLGDTVCSTD